MSTEAQSETGRRTLGARLRSFLADLPDRLFTPVDAASIVFFRVAFGLMLVVHVAGYLSTLRLQNYYYGPAVLFKFQGFGWIEPIPMPAMKVLLAAMVLAGAMITVGLYYRWAAGFLTVGLVYLHTLDSARYNNHYYLLVLLCFLLCLVPAHRAGSLDARRNKAWASDQVPAWCLWLLRFQVGVPYFFGGVAKLNYDWVVRGEPIGLWLRNDLAEGTLDLPFFRSAWSGHFFAWSGLLLDLLVVPALLWPKTRKWAFLAIAAFHLTNSQLFIIGVFPWLMLLLTTIYFEPDWPRRVGLIGRGGKNRGKRGAGAGSAPLEQATEGRRRLILAFLAIWVVVQVAMPLRHWLMPGHVDWTEEGNRYAWRMKIRHKVGDVAFEVTDASGRTTLYKDFTGVITTYQRRALIHHPELIRQFAHHLANRLEETGMRDVEVRVVSQISFNGRPFRPLIDPEVDLAAEPPTFWHSDWIVPYDPSLE